MKRYLTGKRRNARKTHPHASRRETTEESRHHRTPCAANPATRLAALTTNPPTRRPRTLNPPAPPILLTPRIAADPNTPIDVLWHIARHAPELRRWLVINPNADATLLEHISQAGGPGVKQALTILIETLTTSTTKDHT